MTKFLVIFLLLLVLLAFVYWLIRPYIKMAQKAFGFIQDVRTGTFGADVRKEREKVTTPHRLAKCAQCGTFVPTQRALQGRGDAVYCSAACQRGA